VRESAVEFAVLDHFLLIVKPLDFMVEEPRQSFSGPDVPMRRCPTWFLPWIRPVRWCHDHKTVLIGAGVAAISFNSRMFLTISRLSRAAMDATILAVSPGAS